MNKKYPTYKVLDLPSIANRIGEMWGKNKVFDKSISNREGKEQFVFFEGPPSANGLPGIHHVMGRSIKDIFCRYKTLKGFQVKRRAGWDTHGLPVELGVEKSLNITKEDIGKKISIENYNKACKEAVMRYTDIWNNLTSKMGYWVDMENPYITYESKYMESVWWLIAQLYSKNMIYKGYTVQPYSPKAGTGLSTHELNQPGCYKDVTDTTVVAQFKMQNGQINPFGLDQDIYFLAWTTTPWTLPSNTALTVGSNIDYVLVKTFNQYTYKSINVVLAKHLINVQFSKTYRLVDDESELSNYKNGDKTIPYYIYDVYLGKDLLGLKYDQLLPYALPYESPDKAFKIISGDFVTTEDGTGIVHTAPTFGADDARVAEAAGVPGMLVLDDKENPTPLVNLQGKFTHHMKEFAGLYVKNEYYDDDSAPDKSVDVQIAIKLKTENKAFRVEKYVHSYPHCWRTDKPILYYPLDSWFVKAKQNKKKMMELNKTINWTPEATGAGRFGKWLENLNDWNLSRSRYWGIPIPIWSTSDGIERICISSIEELKKECEKSLDAGLMKVNPIADFKVGDMSELNYLKVDLHKNHMDEIILLSSSGLPMRRESDLIDVWFDSGAMPYAQSHYPFENAELINNKIGYPADFIAEGVDQTRGWFYTLHAISTMVFDNVAFKNVLSNGLVLDKNGQKMSKRLGNAIDPFITIDKYGPDATRWYMITNSQPWDNLKFDEDGILEVQRKFFGTLYNTYSFFALYANIDDFDYNASDILYEERPEIDRWILSKLNSLIKEVDKAFSLYDATKSGRLIQSFVIEHLSNWYVRLCRRRYWKQSNGESLAEKDKLSAYQTLYKCLETVSVLGAPIAPFFMDQLFLDLNTVSKKSNLNSVHLFTFPQVQESFIDLKLEAQMDIAQKISSLILGLRKKEKIRVRQPLNKIMVPVLDSDFETNVLHVKDLILSEVNVKEIKLLKEDSSVFVKSIKPNFKTIGPKYGKHMKAISSLISGMTKDDISYIESNKSWSKEIDGELIELDVSDFEISAKDIPGWLVKSENGLTVALDVKITDELRAEGIARELVNRIQNFRKDSGLDITDKITLKLDTNEFIKNAIMHNKSYVCNEVLANEILFEKLDDNSFKTNIVEQDDVRLRLLKN